MTYEKERLTVHPEANITGLLIGRTRFFSLLIDSDSFEFLRPQDFTAVCLSRMIESSAMIRKHCSPSPHRFKRWIIRAVGV